MTLCKYKFNKKIKCPRGKENGECCAPESIRKENTREPHKQKEDEVNHTELNLLMYQRFAKLAIG